MDTTTMIAFDNYLFECKKKNILVLLVWTPEYIEGQKFVKNLKQNMSKETKNCNRVFFFKIKKNTFES